MIQMTIDGAHKAGKWAGICGELGADTTLTERFVEMGIDELNVAKSIVLRDWPTFSTPDTCTS